MEELCAAKAKSGAGILFYAEDTERYLFALRSPLVSEPGTWCTWGGKTEPGETPEQTAMREAKEESGYRGPMELAHLYTRKNEDFTFETFVGVVPKEFKPVLCWETQGYKWATLDELPSPLHHGIEEMFESMGESDDDYDEDDEDEDEDEEFYEIDHGKKPSKSYPAGNKNSGFEKQYYPEELKAALSYINYKKKTPKSVTFVDYKLINPSELKNNEGKEVFSKTGWGKTLKPKELVKKLNSKMDRQFYDYVWLWRRNGKQHPVIVIDGVLADGMGRAALYNALGEPVYAAIFTSKKRSESINIYSVIINEVKNEKSDLKFRFDDEDESGGSGFTIIVSKDGKDAGNIFVTIEDLDSDCYAFEPYKDEPFHDEICDYAEVVSIQHLMVEEEFQGQGIATELMKRSAKEIKKRWSGVPVYINASPMDGPEGISLDALVSFYQKFGFKVLKRYPEHSNALLWKESITHHVEAKNDWKNLGITLSHQEGKTKFAEIPTLSVTATLPNGDVAGHVEFEQVGGDWEPQNVNVLGQLQRKGIASAMYDYATQVSGMKVIPSQSQTSYGKALWKDRSATHPVQERSAEDVVVYRLENELGQGPYAANLSGQWLGSPNLDRDKGFSNKDREEFDSSKHLFGFTSKEQAKLYFENPDDKHAKGDWQRLLNRGFKLKKYTGKKVWFGKHQVFFEPKSPKRYSSVFRAPETQKESSDSRTEAKAKVTIKNVIDPKVVSIIPKTDALSDYILNPEKTIGGATAYIDGKMVGFASLHYTTIQTGIGDVPSDTYAILEMIVRPTYRGQGIGEKLLKAAIDFGHIEGFDKFIGYTHHSEGMKALSKKYNIIDIDDVDWNLIHESKDQDISNEMLDLDDLYAIESYVDEKDEPDSLEDIEFKSRHKVVPIGKTAYRAISLPSKKVPDLSDLEYSSAWTFNKNVALEFAELQGNESHNYAVVVMVNPKPDQVVVYLPNTITDFNSAADGDEELFYDVIHTIRSEYEVVLRNISKKDVRVLGFYNRKNGKITKESNDPKYDASVKGAFDFLTKQKAWIPEGVGHWWNESDVESAVTHLEAFFDDEEQYEVMAKELEKQIKKTKPQTFDPKIADKMFLRRHGETFDSVFWHGKKGKPSVKLEPSIAIKFQGKCYLLDGQHRLNQAIKDNEPVDVAVVDADWLKDFDIEPVQFSGFKIPSIVDEELSEQSSDVERAMKLINGAVSKIQYVANISNVKINTDLDQLKKKAFFIISHPECAKPGNCPDHVMEQVNNAFSDKFKEILVDLNKYLSTLKGVPQQEIIKLLASIEAEDKKKQEVYDMDPPWNGIDEAGDVISGRDLLDIYYEMTPDSDGADRVERILGEVGRWKLTRVPISMINYSEGNVKAPASQKLIQKYAGITTKAPPVILDTFGDEYEIVDGWHRIAVAKARGDEEIEAYVPA